MRKRTIWIQVEGAGVSPETLRASDLAELIVQFETAILETAKAEQGELPDEAMVSLVAVGEGSAACALALHDRVVPAAQSVSNAVPENDYGALPTQAHEALHRISSRADREHWHVSVRAEAGAGVRAFTISEEHPVPAPPAPPEVAGTTTVFGRCLRVGGVTRPRAWIRLEQGGDLIIDVSERLAKELARKLYEEVSIEGKATWRADDWSVLRFDAVRVLPYRASDPVAAFDRLATAAGGRWDGVDPVDHVRRLRSGGEEG